MKVSAVVTRAVFITVEVFAALMFLFPMTMGIIDIGNVFGLTAVSAAFIVTVSFDRFSAFIKRHLKKPTGKVLIIFTGSVLSLLVLYAVVLTASMIFAAVNRPQSPDAVIVLGCKVQPSGNPSLMLQKRIEAASAYLDENRDVICVVSGGKGGNEPESEADVMKRILVENGISSDRIIVEDRSSSTEENLSFSLELLREMNIKAENIAIVTDSFHQLRASLMAKKQGAEPFAISSETPIGLVPTYWVREWFGLSHFFVFGR